MLADQYILNLSKLSLNMKDLLPEYSGIYYVLDENQTVWYIGQAKNIRKRWQGKAHHRIYQLESQKKYHFYIYYEAVNASELNNVEKQRIQQYDPHLNKSPVKTKKVRPVESLLRETVSSIHRFAFVIGIELPNNEIFFSIQKSRKNTNSEVIHIGISFDWLDQELNTQSYEEQAAIIKSSFQSRKVYAKKWEAIPKIYQVVHRLYINNYIVEYNHLFSSSITSKGFEEFLEYRETTLAGEPIRCLTAESISKIQQKAYSETTDTYVSQVIKQLQPYDFDPIKLLFNDSIDREESRQSLEKISEDYKTGKRGFGSRSKVINIDQLVADRSIDLQKYEGKVLSFPNNKIGLYLQCFSFDLKQPMPITSLVRGMFDNNLKITVAANLNLVHFLTRVDRQAWLLFEDYFQSFARPATKLNEGEGFIDKFYVSARKFIVPAKANIKIESFSYSVWIPFGPAPEFPTFEAATTEIRRRLQESDLPDLKITFKRETTTH
ncbi:MAG: hypothetical protein VKL42_01465 [Snowella sp.]|nr:hypothetical protein [Snowella sp.]